MEDSSDSYYEDLLMSFSGDVKRELAGIIPGSKKQAEAELRAFLMSSEGICDENGIKMLVFGTENVLLAKKVFTILKKYYNIGVGVYAETNRRRGRNSYGVKIYDIKDALRQGGRNLKKNPGSGFAFIRGMFQLYGSINDPKRSYHMEFVLPTKESAEFLKKVLDEELSEGAKLTVRGDSHLVYIKDSSLISDVLAAMGANVAMMEFENARALGETRGKVNRMVNCEVGNLRKSAEAGKKQLNYIRLIQEKMGLDKLPDGLREIAYLRLDNPEASLQEIGEMMEPALGRSGVNHRLQKLLGIAEELIKSQEEM